MKEFTVFGIKTSVNKRIHLEDKYRAYRDIDDYSDESLYFSNKVYRHDCDDNIYFHYQYGIESYTYTDDDGQEKTYYTLYLVPTYNSLSIKKKQCVVGCCCNNPDIMDVFDYGCQIVMARECRDGKFDMDVVENIANIVDFIDRMRGFFLDKYQNRIGTTGWDMLYDYVKDVDYIKAALKRYETN